MSHHQSACVPPPSDYAPRDGHSSGSHQPTGRYWPRGGGGGGGGVGGHQQRGAYMGRGGRGGYRAGRGGRGSGHGSHRQPPELTSVGCKAGGEVVEEESRLKNQPKDRFHRNEDDDYFEQVAEEEEEADQGKGGRDEGSNGGERSQSRDQDSAGGDNDDDEDDPLDAYMNSLDKGSPTSVKDKTASIRDGSVPDDESKNDQPTDAVKRPPEGAADKRGVRLDIDETDDIEESYYKYVEEQVRQDRRSATGDAVESLDDLVEYDKDGNVVAARRLKREVEPLPPIDHSQVEYGEFERSFYVEHEEIKSLTQEQSEELRTKLDIKVTGENPPKPVCSFAHFKFDERLMRVIRRSEYTQPTPIQAQAIPAALLGRNIIGIAMTGSGKTAAYLWPMIVHIMGQDDLKRGDGPIGLVLVPTRELAIQVYTEAKKFSSSYNIAVVCAYGGGSKYEQTKDLEAGAEIVVATPGRLIDLIKQGATNLRRVTYLVLDEADRFFEMGFEVQVRSICDHIRPDRQTLLFSATFKKRIEQLARTVTEDPIKILQKALGEANEDVTQHVITLAKNADNKWTWLTDRLVEFTSAGSVLVFVTRITNSEELHRRLADSGRDVLLLHGDMEQSERNRVITAFKRKDKEVMIATDVAARGLDISHIRTVINYDVARDIDTHIHRVGRTGRAGSKGDAYTLISEDDKEFAGHLVRNLESSKQTVNDDLMRIAMQSHNFRKSRRQNQHQHPHPHPHHQHQHQHHHQHHTHHHHHRNYQSSDNHQSHRSSHDHYANFQRQPGVPYQSRHHQSHSTDHLHSPRHQQYHQGREPSNAPSSSRNQYSYPIKRPHSPPGHERRQQQQQYQDHPQNYRRPSQQQDQPYKRSRW